ncbi:hypothetical protein ACXWOR_10535, partial [Streptococcus pyogenes]
REDRRLRHKPEHQLFMAATSPQIRHHPRGKRRVFRHSLSGAPRGRCLRPYDFRWRTTCNKGHR